MRSISMSSGRPTTTGPGRPLAAVWKARDTISGTRAGSSISVAHLVIEPKHGAVVEFLEGLALAHVARHLADEHDERRRILARDVDAGRGIGGAGPAGDEADAGPAGRLADRLRHHRRAALLPAHGDGEIAVVKRVERRKIALARHAEHVAHAVNAQLIDQNLGGGAHIVLSAHRRLRDSARADSPRRRCKR